MVLCVSGKIWNVPFRTYALLYTTRVMIFVDKLKNWCEGPPFLSTQEVRVDVKFRQLSSRGVINKGLVQRGVVVSTVRIRPSARCEPAPMVWSEQCTCPVISLPVWSMFRLVRTTPWMVPLISIVVSIGDGKLKSIPLKGSQLTIEGIKRYSIHDILRRGHCVSSDESHDRITPYFIDDSVTAFEHGWPQWHWFELVPN